ncbi:MAG TPA: hypothetical protein DEB39_03300 [Planctomycetaceae bacterium]|nr:hypothetical protein [Planctomycetaceae bacterium]
MTNNPNDADSTLGRYHRNDVGDTAPSMLVRLQHKDDAAIETFVQIYTKLVRAWCRRANKKLAEPLLRDDRKDIASIVIAKAVRKLCDKDAETIQNLRGWLYRITERSIIDFLRKRNKRPVQPGNSNVINDLPDKDVLNLSDEQEDRLFILNEIITRIKPTIKNEQHWEIYQLTVVKGKDSEEVAQAMNMKSASVRQIKKRILDRIRQEYALLGMEDERPQGIPMD